MRHRSIFRHSAFFLDFLSFAPLIFKLSGDTLFQNIKVLYKVFIKSDYGSNT